MKISRSIFIGGVMLLVLLFTGCTPQLNLPAMQRETQETLLVQIDRDNWILNSFKITPDNHSLIYANNVDGQQVLVINGKEADKRYDEIVAYLVLTSQDSRHIAYAAREGENWYMVYDGREIGPYDKILAYEKYMYISPDGQRLLYAVQQDEEMFVVVDEKLYGPYEDVSLGIGAFSADNSRFAFAAKTGDNAMMIADGEARPEYNAISEWFFAVQGSSLVYHAEKDGKHCVVLNGTQGLLYNAVSEIQFSQDGKRLAYIATDGGEHFVVVDGQKQTSYPYVIGAIFSPDSKRLAYSVSTQEGAYIVVDDEKFGPYDRIDVPLFSPDSQHIACIVAKDKGYAMILDGKQGPYFADIIPDQVVFSPDSSRLAYVVQTESHEHSANADAAQLQKEEPEKFAVVVDGKRSKIYNGIGLDSIVFSPDSKHVAYMAVEGEKWVVVLDGKKLGEYDDISSDPPIFSPDSNLLLFQAQVGEEFSVFVNGQAGKPYDGVINKMGGKIIFDSDYSFHYLAAKDNSVYVVEEKFTPPGE